MMKLIIRATTIAAAAAAAASIGVVGAATASAAPVTGSFGTPERLNDANGAIVSSYTVSNLEPSNDMVNTPVTGKLWEATTTVDAVQGTVTPSIPFFNARAADGQNYRVLFQAPSPAGINAQPLTPGGRSAGKIYFDVTGPAPTQVVYNDAVQDRMVWST
jgi:hypothetical protein